MKEVYLNGGWTIEAKAISGRNGVNIFAVNKAKKIQIMISIELLHVFGFVVNGCELGITGVYRTDNIDQQNIILTKIITETLALSSQEVDFFTMRSYLKEKYKNKSKIESSAIVRVLGIIEEEWQELNRFKEQQVEEGFMF